MKIRVTMKNGAKSETKSVATPSKSLAVQNEKDAKGVQAVWTGQPERQERLTRPERLVRGLPLGVAMRKVACPSQVILMPLRFMRCCSFLLI